MTAMQIGAQMVTDLAKSFSSVLVAKMGKRLKDKKAKDAVYFQSAYETYLSSTKAHYEKTKTLLYKNEPQYLYDFYECLGVCLDEKIIDTSNVNNLLEVGNKLIITGTGGIGKTIMMKHCFLSCIQHTGFIPVLIELRSINDKTKDSINLEEIIYRNLKNYNFNLEKEYYDYSLELGGYVFIFDGYDEVKSELAKIVQEDILRLSNKYPDNYYIVSSRPMDNNFVAWSDFVELNARGLDKKQALSLIKKLKYDKDIKDKFYKALDDYLYKKYRTFARNPLLLTIMLMTFAEGGEIPEDFNDFYEQAFMTLYKAHDASKGAYVRDKASKLGYNDFKLIFSYVCFQSFFKSQYQFKEQTVLDLIVKAKEKCPNVPDFKPEDFLKDLTNSVCMLIQDGLVLRFVHRSFQEYFAAYYVTKLGDKDQEKLIKSWLEDRGIIHSSEILNILKFMEGERFEKNVVYPGLKVMKKATDGLTDAEIIEVFFEGVIVREDNDRAGYLVRESYVFAIYELMRTNKTGKGPSKNSTAFVQKLKAKFPVPKKFNPILIQDIINDDELKIMMIEDMKTFLEGYRRCMELLESKTHQRKTKKYKLSSILDDL